MAVKESVHHTALELERSVWSAVLEKNGDALAQLFADDYVEITIEGRRFEKHSIVEVSPQVDEIESYAIDSEVVLPMGAHGFALSYHLTLEGRCRGEPIVPKERWATSVWAKREGAWKCVLFQQSQHRETNAKSPPKSSAL